MFYNLKRAKRDLKIVLMVFLKKILFRAIWSFWPKNGTFLQLWIWSQVFFLILNNEAGQQVHENFISCFLRKNLIWGNFIFLDQFLTVCLGVVKIEPDYCYYWIFKQDMISFMITTGSLNSHGMIRIVKQSGHDFSGKRSFDGYCMDFMWCLCLEVNIQQRVV